MATNDGAGTYLDCSNIIMEKTVLTMNSSDDGGGIYSNSCTLQLNNCQVNNNDANDRGGGIATRSSTIFLDSTSIVGNDTQTVDYGKGGGLYFDDSSIFIIGCDIIENYSVGDGGGIYSKSTVCCFSRNWNFPRDELVITQGGDHDEKEAT